MTSSPPSPPQDPTRRKILGWSSIGVGAITAAGLGGWLGRKNQMALTKVPPTEAVRSAPMQAASRVEQPLIQSEFHREAFIPHLQTEFAVEPSSEKGKPCKLIDISPLTMIKGAGASFASFTVMFEADEGFLSEGGICRVSHEGMNTMEIFLTPVGRIKDKKSYLEAAFTLRAS